jgi:hypothetical protein
MARSVIASAQRSVNLFAEPMPQQTGEPAMYAHYPTPGIALAGTLPQGGVRGLKQTTNGNIYAVSGSGVYRINPTTWTGTLLGSITPGLTTPVSMQDNTLTLVIVDGSANGWTVAQSTDAFAQISDPTGMFSGADRVDYLDTYLLFNKPGTPQFYSSQSLAVTFDTLWFADKSSFTDLLVTLAVAKREIWLLGQRTCEIWANMGTPDFPFGQIQATFVDHGVVAKYSVATHDNSILWLAQNREGATFVLQAAGYQTKRVSTYAVEAAWTDYTVTDAVGFVYMLDGHAFYVLSFPTSDRTWVMDIGDGSWHEWVWTDGSGNDHRHRVNCVCSIYGGSQVLGGDWQNGNLYLISHNNLTDNGAPIKRSRSFPHLLNDAKRVFYTSLIADIETGMGGSTGIKQGLIECFFTGPDGTLVENYSPSPVEQNATWSRVDGAGAELEGNKAIAVNGDTTYTSSGPFPPVADYSIAFRVLPNAAAEVNGSSALVAVRATSVSGSGYWAGIQIYNGNWYAQLGGELMPLGLPPSDGWYDCLLTALGTLLTLSVQRSSDGMYMGPNGQWQSTVTPAIALTDGTYTAPGRIMFGLNSIPTGVMATEADVNSTWLVENGSGSWEWDEVPTDSLGLDNIVASTIVSPYQLFLDWSDDRGHTYGNPVPQTLGGNGEYVTSVQFQRLGYARDRVFRLTWTAPVRTALQGAWVELNPGLS